MSLRACNLLLAIVVFLPCAFSDEGADHKGLLMNRHQIIGQNRFRNREYEISKIDDKKKKTFPKNKKQEYEISMIDDTKKETFPKNRKQMVINPKMWKNPKESKKKNQENMNPNLRVKQLEGQNSKASIAKNVQRQSSSCKCGLSNPLRIIGGEKIDLPRKYPWLVYIKINRDGNSFMQCTGTIISSGHVLTAAHCAHNGEKWLLSKDVTVLIGDHNVNKNNDDLSEETIEMKARIIRHNKFDYDIPDYDIILLKLEKQLNLNEFELVRPICLPKSVRSKYIRKQAIVAGWGLTDPSSSNSPDTPYQLELKTNNKKCRGYKVTKNQICTDILWQKKSPFYGDSGGPLMVEEDGRYVQIGLLSGGQTRNDKVGSKGVGVFTSTAKLLKWITNKIKNDVKCS